MNIFGYHITTKRALARKITRLIGDDYEFLPEAEKCIIAANIGHYNASTFLVIVPHHRKYRDLDYFMGPQFHDAYKLKVGHQEQYLNFVDDTYVHTTFSFDEARVYTKKDVEQILSKIPGLTPIAVKP